MKPDKSIVPKPEGLEQVAEPFLRLLRHLDPRDLADSPSLTMTVERFKRRFLQRLLLNLHVAESIIVGALVADGYTEAAARAEVDRFSHQVARLLREFQQNNLASTVAAEEISQAQEQVKAGLARIAPIQTRGEA